MAWLAELASDHGGIMLAVAPLDLADHTHIEPADESRQRFGIPFRSSFR